MCCFLLLCFFFSLSEWENCKIFIIFFMSVKKPFGWAHQARPFICIIIIFLRVQPDDKLVISANFVPFVCFVFVFTDFTRWPFPPRRRARSSLCRRPPPPCDRIYGNFEIAEEWSASNKSPEFPSDLLWLTLKRVWVFFCFSTSENCVWLKHWSPCTISCSNFWYVRSPPPNCQNGSRRRPWYEERILLTEQKKIYFS